MCYLLPFSQLYVTISVCFLTEGPHVVPKNNESLTMAEHSTLPSQMPAMVTLAFGSPHAVGLFLGSDP